MKNLMLTALAMLFVACGQAPAPPSSPPPPAPAPDPVETPAAAPAEFAISDVEVLVLPGGMGAGYLRVQGGATADRLEAVSTPVAHMAETHESVDEDGVMKMQPRPEGFEVPAGGELVLEQGGKHIMFHGIEVADDVTEIELTLRFTEAGERTVKAIVKRPGEE